MKSAEKCVWSGSDSLSYLMHCLHCHLLLYAFVDINYLLIIITLLSWLEDFADQHIWKIVTASLYAINHCESVCLDDWWMTQFALCLAVFWVLFSSQSKPKAACMQINSKRKYCGGEMKNVEPDEPIVRVSLTHTHKKNAVDCENSSTYLNNRPIQASDSFHSYLTNHKPFWKISIKLVLGQSCSIHV